MFRAAQYVGSSVVPPRPPHYNGPRPRRSPAPDLGLELGKRAVGRELRAIGWTLTWTSTVFKTQPRSSSCYMEQTSTLALGGISAWLGTVSAVCGARHLCLPNLGLVAHDGNIIAALTAASLRAGRQETRAG